MGLNKMLVEIENVRNRLIKDSGVLLDLCINFEREVKHKYNEEIVNNNNKFDGLEDFKKLVLISRKNCNVAKLINNIIRKNLYDLQKFEIEENK